MEEVKRKLASIRLVSEIRPIEGADNIELAIVDGWQCIVKKGDFITASLCVYFEIDSFLPIKPEFEFLRKSSYKKMGDKEGFRLKTIRLRGHISQGLALKIEDVFVDGKLEKLSAIGCDVTEILGVIKYEQHQNPVKGQNLNSNRNKTFPSFIRKTDLERIQNIWDEVKDCEETFEVSIKLDGTSCTFYWNNGKFGVCSRNFEILDDNSFCNKIKTLFIFGFKALKAAFRFRFSHIRSMYGRFFKFNGTANVYWEMAKKYGIKDILKEYGRNIALQGEIVGEGIQCNPEKIKGHDFYLFDVFDIDKHRYYTPTERDIFHAGQCSLIKAEDGLVKMPYLDGIDDKKMTDFKSIEDVLEYAEGPSVKGEIREGLAFKSYTSSLRFKVVNNQYLLKHEN